MDVVEFCRKLVSCKSITPNDCGAIDFLAEYFSSLGFFIKTFKNKGVKNLFAVYDFGNGEKQKLFSEEKFFKERKNDKKLLFFGHSDVVPEGENWDTDPFLLTEKNGRLYGRGVADMKGGISAFAVAIKNYLQKKHPKKGSLYIIITGDEEIGSYEGIESVIDWLKENKITFSDALLAEPSSDKVLGDRVFIGHRGSINISISSKGKQGHVAYEGSYKNSLSHVIKFVAHILNYKWKHENKKFPKISIEPTLLYTNNYAVNVVPDFSKANINVRFGADYKSKDIIEIFKNEAQNFCVELEFFVSGEPYSSENFNLQKKISEAIFEITNVKPRFSCEGGTSDARFMINLCNVIEFGIEDRTIHQKNENVSVEDLKNLGKIYERFLEKYFMN